MTLKLIGVGFSIADCDLLSSNELPCKVLGVGATLTDALESNLGIIPSTFSCDIRVVI